MKEVEAVYKNAEKLGVILPDFGEDVPPGHHPMNVEVTVNGQQYTSHGLTFMYNAVDPNLTEDELKKLDEAEMKAAKKPPGKKK